ncbi:hypothetical protein ACVWW1_009940 [Bradyrhizobium sp. JR3.5]
MGKGFAYWGYRPLFVGEIAFVAGLFVLLRSGCLVAVFASGPSLLLAAAMGWALLRTFPYLDTYGSDALRDSVILVYGVFAFVVAALLIEDYRRIDTIISYYQKFLDIYVPVVPILFPLSFYFADYIPNVPGTSVGLVWLGAGEVATHLAGATVFILTGMRRPTPIWTACLITAVVMVGAVSRAAVLAFAVPVVLAALALGKLRPVLVVVATGTVLLAASYAIETTVSGYQEARVSTERRISVAQIVENIASIVGQGGAQTEDTTQWRANWWRTIVEKTVHGPYFWTGRGFGVNLAVEDGLARANSERPLRSPHSAHMTILARAGVPGLVLWAAFSGRLVWHAASRHGAGLQTRAHRMGRVDAVYRLLRLLLHHQRFVRRRTRGADAGDLVLVPDRLRHRRDDDLPLPAGYGRIRSIGSQPATAGRCTRSVAACLTGLLWRFTAVSAGPALSMSPALSDARRSNLARRWRPARNDAAGPGYPTKSGGLYRTGNKQVELAFGAKLSARREHGTRCNVACVRFAVTLSCGTLRSGSTKHQEETC